MFGCYLMMLVVMMLLGGARRTGEVAMAQAKLSSHMCGPRAGMNSDGASQKKLDTKGIE